MCIFPERLLLQCPNLESVHASNCQELLIGAIENQVKLSYLVPQLISFNFFSLPFMLCACFLLLHFI